MPLPPLAPPPPSSKGLRAWEGSTRRAYSSHWLEPRHWLEARRCLGEVGQGLLNWVSLRLQGLGGHIGLQLARHSWLGLVGHLPMQVVRSIGLVPELSCPSPLEDRFGRDLSESRTQASIFPMVSIPDCPRFVYPRLYNHPPSFQCPPQGSPSTDKSGMSDFALPKVPYMKWYTNTRRRQGGGGQNFTPFCREVWY